MKKIKCKKVRVQNLLEDTMNRRTSMFLHYCLGPLVIQGNTGAFTQIGKISYIQ